MHLIAFCRRVLSVPRPRRTFVRNKTGPWGQKGQGPLLDHLSLRVVYVLFYINTALCKFSTVQICVRNPVSCVQCVSIVPTSVCLKKLIK